MAAPKKKGAATAAPRRTREQRIQRLMLVGGRSRKDAIAMLRRLDDVRSAPTPRKRKAVVAKKRTRKLKPLPIKTRPVSGETATERLVRLERAARDARRYDVAERHAASLTRLRERERAAAKKPPKRGRGRTTGATIVEVGGREVLLVRLRKGQARGVRQARESMKKPQRAARQPVRGDRVFTTEDGIWLAAGAR